MGGARGKIILTGKNQKNTEIPPKRRRQGKGGSTQNFDGVIDDIDSLQPCVSANLYSAYYVFPLIFLFLFLFRQHEHYSK